MAEIQKGNKMQGMSNEQAMGNFFAKLIAKYPQAKEDAARLLSRLAQGQNPPSTASTAQTAPSAAASDERMME